MSTATPNNSTNYHRSASQSKARPVTPPPYPVTPLRPPSRGSLWPTQTPIQGSHAAYSSPLSALEPAFAELSDGMADLEANFMHLQIMHESLARFNECFASFLYGLNVNAFCVDFPEAPIAESFSRPRDSSPLSHSHHERISSLDENNSVDHLSKTEADADQTFLTTDTSFVDNPPSAKISTSSRFSAPGPGLSNTSSGVGLREARRGGFTAARRDVGGSRGRPSGLARATGRGRGNRTR